MLRKEIRTFKLIFLAPYCVFNYYSVMINLELYKTNINKQIKIDLPT